MGFCLFVVVDCNEKKVALVMFQTVEILFVFDLVECAFGRAVVLQFDNHRRFAWIEWNKNHVGKTFARGHFLDNRIVVEGKNKCKVNRRCKCVLVVVTAVGCNVDMTCVESLLNSAGMLCKCLVQEFFLRLDYLVGRRVVFQDANSPKPLFCRLHSDTRSQRLS